MSISIQIASDLHINANNDYEIYIEKAADILVLLGDIGNVALFDNYTLFMTKLCANYAKVYLIPGNHEFYVQQSEKSFYYEAIKLQLYKLEEIIQNLTILDNKFVDLPGNIRLFGSTLWSYIPEDSRVMILPIRSENGYWVDASWINKHHFSDVYAIEQAISQAKQDNKRLLIATHYAPTMYLTLDENHMSDPKRHYYATNLDRLLFRKNVYIWMCGHTHKNCDYLTIGDTRIVSNQYRGTNYLKNKVLVIKHKA
jgi:Icc-related predicted phosphoesterase